MRFTRKKGHHKIFIFAFFVLYSANKFRALESNVKHRFATDYAFAGRSGLAEKITLEEGLVASTNRSDEVVAFDDALKQPAILDERKSRVVEMKFFGGLDVKEIAEVLKTSPETVKRDWKFARTWLLRELAGAE